MSRYTNAPLSFESTQYMDQYLDPADRDEYDDFVYDRPRSQPRFPQARVALTSRGSIRQSYHAPRIQQGVDSPPRRTHTPEESAPEPGTFVAETYSRSDSPTRMPLTVGEKGPESGWLRDEDKSRRRRKWIIIGIIAFLLLGAVTGVIVYLVKFRNTGSSVPTNGRNGSGATAKDLKSDSKLKRIFDGMDYTPLNAQYPACGVIQENVTADVAILSQLTNKVRLYGTDCAQATMVLDAIQDLQVDLTVFIGVWVDRNDTTLERQLGDMYSILRKYPTSMIDGVAVGNEVLFRQDRSEAELISLIQTVRTNITAMNLKKTIPICTRYYPSSWSDNSDLGSRWTPTLSAAVDCIMANIHPFFAGVNVTDAADWTIEFLNNNVVPTTKGLSPAPNIIISEGLLTWTPVDNSWLAHW
jgi:exo-beta-1,3-glucanase (GH17 family)